jgi:hypothetical protein
VAGRRRLSLLSFVAIGLAVTAALVIVVAPRANSNPDGLEKVAADTGIDGAVQPHSLGDGPFADYATTGVDHAALGTIIAGLVGVTATFVLCAALVYVVRRRRSTTPSVPAVGPSA